MRGRRVLSAILVVLPAIVGVATYPTTLKAALVDAPTSDDLIPKMVTTVTYSAHSAPEASPPTGPLPEVKRVGAKSLPRGGGTDLMFLGGALATVLLVAGLVFQIIGRLRQVRLTHSHHDAGAGIAQSVEEAVPVSSPTRSDPSDMRSREAIRPMTSSRRWTNGYSTCKKIESTCFIRLVCIACSHD